MTAPRAIIKSLLHNESAPKITAGPEIGGSEYSEAEFHGNSHHNGGVFPNVH